MPKTDFSYNHELTLLTHFDGRNGQKLISLRPYFSEFAWIKYRLDVMLTYVIFLSQEKIITPLDVTKGKRIKRISDEFSVTEAEQVKLIEKKTNHDLRALEIFIEQKFRNVGLDNYSVFINLGIGSEDINNVALRQQIKHVWGEILAPELENLTQILINVAEKNSSLPMLARTHGQPASVTTLGKELALFLHQLGKQINLVKAVDFSPKFSGEVGNFNSLKFVLPKTDWLKLEEKFLKSLGFGQASPATQIPSYDDLNHFFSELKLLNNVLIGLCKDMWLYASFGYLSFKNISGEVGSAGMPHKINPQYFEGAEGGLEYANSQLDFFVNKFSYSRLQRDFSDSTVRRNIVIPIAYCMLSYESMIIVFNRLQIEKEVMVNDLGGKYEIMSEVLKTELKYAGVSNAYDWVKNHMRGKKIDRKAWGRVVDTSKLKAVTKRKLKELTPKNLTGESERIAKKIVVEAKKRLFV